MNRWELRRRDVIKALGVGMGCLPLLRAGYSKAAGTPKRLLIVARGWQAGLPLTHEIQAAYAITGHHLELQAWQERDL